MTEVLSTTAICKRFGGLQALDDVTFTLRSGEIRALCGENGAGKSTFVKLLTGLYRPDGGVIRLDRREVSIESPRHAEELGIGIVSQELSLAPHLSILDNIWLGSAETPFFYRSRSLRQRARAALATLGADNWDLDRPVGDLALGEQQMVEIARLLARNAKVMILDEPTATLSDVEIARILDVLRRLRALGHAIIYVSHRLGEIFQVCDGVTVFRNGRHVATKPVAEVDRDRLIEMMLGRASSDMYPPRSGEAARQGGLSVRRLHIADSVRDFDFDAPRGKITCIAGQLGSGAGLITRALAGLVPGATGDVRLDGAPILLGSVARALRHGIHGIEFISDDRAGEGIFPELSVLDNLVATRLDRHAHAGMLSWRELDRVGKSLAATVTIDAARLPAAAGVLSGGNQQKILFARSLERGAAGVLIMNEPTRGIDVGARADIYRLMRLFTERGHALIMMSSDLEEVSGMADIVYTVFRGRNIGRYEGAAVEMERILADMIHPSGVAGAAA